MIKSFHQDTIVAIATASGVGAIGVIRLSGSDAVVIADKVFKGKLLAKQATHTIHYGHIVNPKNDEVIDEVVASLFLNPKSYTGEDVVEISGHGSPFVLGQILNVCLQEGARLADPGEFTQRAFLNGKLDLAQAEAVADLIAANSSAAKRTALNHLRGGFSNSLNSLRDELIQFAALIELELDFSDEDVEFADRTQFKKVIEALKTKVNSLVDSFQLGNVIKNGVSVAIIGAPNAGKSTLLNALLNEERAIVSDIAGTTRDTIEELLNINGVLFRFIDTAGIRTTTEDAIESIGIERSRTNAHKADIVLLLEDINLKPSEDWKWLYEMDSKLIKVHTKCDALDKANRIGAVSEGYLQIAAKTHKGIDELKAAIYQKALGAMTLEGTIVTNARHHSALEQIQNSLLEIENALSLQVSGDLLAVDVRRCLYYLGIITGQVEIDRDILGTIFGKFCIGK